MSARSTGYFASIKIPLFGKIWAATTPIGVCAISFGSAKTQFLSTLSKDIEWSEGEKFLNTLFAYLNNFSQGKNQTYNGPLDLSTGTSFQQEIWEAMTTIPWGETRSYAWLAGAVGKPQAYRAAAGACGANPIPIVIPCHRVIASDGTIGGFSLGLKLKRKLLALEGVPTHE